MLTHESFKHLIHMYIFSLDKDSNVDNLKSTIWATLSLSTSSKKKYIKYCSGVPEKCHEGRKVFNIKNQIIHISNCTQKHEVNHTSRNLM